MVIARACRTDESTSSRGRSIAVVLGINADSNGIPEQRTAVNDAGRPAEIQPDKVGPETSTSVPMHTGVMNWLVKEEPSNYNYASFQKDGRTVWSGVRNPVAQKHLRAMQPGDRVFYYHTGDEKAIVGTARVAGAPYPDPANADGSLAAVDLTCGAPLPVPVTLKAVKADPRFADFALTRVPRLSVMPVTDAQWAMLMDMAKG